MKERQRALNAARRQWHFEVRPRWVERALDPSANPAYWAGVTGLIEAVDAILPSFEDGYLIPESVMAELATGLR